ncbi:MAG TPA: zinc ribbon domain-containing protein [Bacteroidetes bacterium]|nr:zinc ribbon domain-containing protein [Bacteroidota bacterium]
MPTYEYRCDDCSKEYEVFHKVREIEDDVLCPVCNSVSHTRLMSVTGMSMNGYSSASSSSSYSSSDSCSSGGCCSGGSCGVN